MQPSKPNQEEASPGFLPFLLQAISTPPPPTSSIPSHKMTASAVAPKKPQQQASKSGGSPQTAYGSQRVILQPTGEGEGRQGSQLTAQQRRVVGDISRLFSSQASRPTKLLIRLNQTQVGTKGEGTLAESKLQRIEITRLDEQAEREIREGPGAAEMSGQGQLMWRGSSEELLSSASSIKIPLSECSNVRQVEAHPSQGTNFSISRQINMMYVAELNMSTLLGMRNPPQLFSRFNRKQEDRVDSIGSNFSEDFTVKKEEGPNFVKLLEIDLFLKRKEVQQHRSEELRQANERMLATHLADKENVEVLRSHVKKLEQKYEKLLEESRKQAEGLKSANAQLQTQVQSKEKAINSVRQLNEQYVKENNQLKAKIKDHLKTIHHLKADLSAHHDKPTDAPVPPQPLPTQNPPNVYPITDRKFTGPKVLLQQRSAINDYGKPSIPRSPKKEVTFNQLYQEPALNSQFYEASPYYELTERPLPAYSKVDRERERQKQTRLANCRSQGLLSRPQPEQPESERQRVQPTSRSQKAVGIRRNNLHTEPPISPSTRNLVRVGKPGNIDGSILLGDKLRDNKSLSSYSNLSGKSLSQRVGFISKPAQPERTKGLLVDYMVQPILQEQMEERPKESQQRLQFRRGEQ